VGLDDALAKKRAEHGHELVVQVRIALLMLLFDILIQPHHSIPVAGERQGELIARHVQHELGIGFDLLNRGKAIVHANVHPKMKVTG